MTDLAFSSALELAELVARRELSPVELTELYLQRIEKLNGDLGAYVTVAADQVLDAARAAAGAVGSDGLGPFHGVPISIKDLEDTAGIRTTHGSKAWAGRVPYADTYVVRRLKEAGFVVLGKTTTPEFGKSVVSEPDGYPPCRNPWDPRHAAGGSSGGAASALAAGLCALSHGNDGGGSIRMPAACCGVVGLKPSRGRISSAPDFPSVFAVQGALTHTVADAGAVLDVLSGYETGDVFWAPEPMTTFLEAARREPGRLRVAVSAQPAIEGTTVDPVARRTLDDAASLLAALGHDVREATPDYGQLPLMAHLALRAAGLIGRHEMPPVDELGPVVRTLYEFGKTMDASAYLEALHEVQLNNRRVVAFFEDYDALVTPTLAVRPPRVGEVVDMIGDPRAREIAQGMSAFVAVWNNTGQPALSIPFEVASDGLPSSVQLVGRPAGEAALLSLAAQIEAAHPWAHRRPPMS